MSDPTPACVIVSAVRLSKALKHAHSKELTEFLDQAVDLPTSDCSIFIENEGLVWISYAQPAGRMRHSLGFRCSKCILFTDNLSSFW